jgi:hypothetical protein
VNDTWIAACCVAPWLPLTTPNWRSPFYTNLYILRCSAPVWRVSSALPVQTLVIYPLGVLHLRKSLNLFDRRTRAVLGVSTLVAAALAFGPAHAAQPAGGTGTSSIACEEGHITWSPTTLWPPDHKMKTIMISYTDDTSDDDMTTITVGMISDNQTTAGVEDPGAGNPNAVDFSGDGNTAMETDRGTATTSVQVAAERSGRDGTRVYTIPVTCMDSGNMMGQTVNLTVSVPHDQGNSPKD